jgi:5,10-methylenetetrahydrofolate reductase
VIESAIDKLQNDSFLSLETTPAKSSNINNILSAIEKYDLQNKVDAFSTTDNPLSKLKYSALISAYKIQEKFKKPVLCTVSMRDRNIIALQSDLLGANDLDIRMILSITGDPASISDQKGAKSVLEGNSLKFLDIVNAFNKGTDLMGNKIIEAPKKIYAFSVINSHAKDYKRLQKKIEKKIEKNTKAIITQPIFCEKTADIMSDIFKEAVDKFNDERNKCKLIYGFFPVTSYKIALFLKNNVPGMYMSDIWLNEMENAHKISLQKESEVGYNLSKKMLNYLYKKEKRVHVMTANHFELASSLIDTIKEN